MALKGIWFAKRRKGNCVSQHADAVSLILMGDWCGEADTA